MAEHNLYINHLFTSLPKGALVQMHKWPEHITLASNFFTEADLDEVKAALSRLCSTTAPLATRAVGTAAFGESGEFPVVLLDYTSAFQEFQLSLVDLIEGLPGYFETPKFAGVGYHPHTTIQPDTNSLEPGAKLSIDSATLFDIDVAKNTRSVLATFSFTG